MNKRLALLIGENETPYPLSYDTEIRRKDDMNWEKVAYNPYYQSVDYMRSKFTGDLSYIAGFEDILIEMAQKAKTPLEQWEERQQDILIQKLNSTDNLDDYKTNSEEFTTESNCRPNTDLFKQQDSDQIFINDNHK